MVVPLPDGTPPERAILAANMETALNAIWDARVSPGMRVLIVGAGLLGLLITSLLSLKRDLSVVVTDVRPESGIKVADFAVSFVTPETVPTESFDVAFHTSASAAGLETALNALGFEGRVIELSWYGDNRVALPLGGSFHANRLQIVSSQVGNVSRMRRASTSHRDRLELALATLADERLDALVTEEIGFDSLPSSLGRLLAPDAAGIATRIVYP
jgi:threonine dehydrogenase-like Zn-dependent dehydrogenase